MSIQAAFAALGFALGFTGITVAVRRAANGAGISPCTAGTSDGPCGRRASHAPAGAPLCDRHFRDEGWGA
jgi:hypothetical protein